MGDWMVVQINWKGSCPSQTAPTRAIHQGLRNACTWGVMQHESTCCILWGLQLVGGWLQCRDDLPRRPIEYGSWQSSRPKLWRRISPVFVHAFQDVCHQEFSALLLSDVVSGGLFAFRRLYSFSAGPIC